MLRTVPALALALLLTLGGLAAASDGDANPADGSDTGSGGNKTSEAPRPANGTAPPPASSTANCDRFPPGADRDRCLKEFKERYCREHPADTRCANATAPKPAKERPQETGKVDRLEHLQFTVDGPGRLSALKVDGQLVLDRLVLDTGSGEFQTLRRGDLVEAGDKDTRLRLHDNPVGLVEFKGDDGGSIALAFPAGVQVTPGPQGHAARIRYPDGRDGLLVADAAEWSGRNVTLTGFASFHIARSDPFAEGSSDGALRSTLKAAVEKRHLGAEVALERHPANASRAVQVLAYDDLEVNVTLPANAGAGVPIAVRLSANLTEGRTIVLHVDPALLGNSTADRLDLHYFDDHEDGTQTEVVFARAASLADVLDPTDDGGRPEYWVVSDADGLQVLVSVPHWSVHTVVLSGLGAIFEPSVLVGIVAGSAGIAVAAVAMFWPRRRLD